MARTSSAAFEPRSRANARGPRCRGRTRSRSAATRAVRPPGGAKRGERLVDRHVPALPRGPRARPSSPVRPRRAATPGGAQYPRRRRLARLGPSVGRGRQQSCKLRRRTAGKTAQSVSSRAGRWRRGTLRGRSTRTAGQARRAGRAWSNRWDRNRGRAPGDRPCRPSPRRVDAVPRRDGGHVDVDGLLVGELHVAELLPGHREGQRGGRRVLGVDALGDESSGRSRS